MTTTAAPRWLVSRSFDLTWFFGGAVLSLVFLALYFFVRAPIVALWWIWLLDSMGRTSPPLLRAPILMLTNGASGLACSSRAC